MLGRGRLTFRNCQVAAPLKPRPWIAPRRLRRPLPQLSSCGPIEANTSMRMRRKAIRLPQLSSCGPIEAYPPHNRAHRTCRLPQLSSCGPIEAQAHGRRPSQPSNAFRNCQVAAPLKPALGVRAAKALGHLPQLSSCGPIEACLLTWKYFADLHLPQLSSCGPIEASRLESALGAHA